MRRQAFSLSALAALPLLLATHTSSAEQAVNATLGSTGIGAEWTVPLNEKLRLRGIISTLSLESEETEDGIDYDVEVSGTNLGAILDWHPFAGGFRLSAGLVHTDMGLDLESSGQDSYDIGGVEYTGDIRLKGDADFATMAPYISLGWASSLNKSGFYFSGELGVMMIGEPKIDITASGLASANGRPLVDVSTNPEFQSDLERERQDLEDEYSDYNIWPVGVLGFGYRF